MTLVVSEVSRFGIAMVADSAVTSVYPPNWSLNSGNPVPTTIRTGAQKIVPIRDINAAMAVWGMGTIGMPNEPDIPIPIDMFLRDFADSVGANVSLEQVGGQLANAVNERIRIGEVIGGFHLAGYNHYEGRYFPALYHIHTGHRDEPPHELRLYRDYPFDHDYDIDEWLTRLNSGRTPPALRNGSYQVYAVFSEYLSGLMQQLESRGFICPDHSRFPGLEARRRYLKLQIQTICEFYRLSNCLETIAMPLSSIIISENGIEDFEPSAPGFDEHQ